MALPCFIAEAQFLYQPVINLKPGSTPNPFPGPFATISSPFALLHKTKTATIAPKHQQQICHLFCSIGWIRSRTSNIYEINETTFCHLSRDKSSRQLATFVAQQSRMTKVALCMLALSLLGQKRTNLKCYKDFTANLDSTNHQFAMFDMHHWIASENLFCFHNIHKFNCVLPGNLMCAQAGFLVPSIYMHDWYM